LNRKKEAQFVLFQQKYKRFYH